MNAPDRDASAILTLVTLVLLIASVALWASILGVVTW
jgi:hypothetical protein